MGRPPVVGRPDVGRPPVLGRPPLRSGRSPERWGRSSLRNRGREAPAGPSPRGGRRASDRSPEGRPDDGRSGAPRFGRSEPPRGGRGLHGRSLPGRPEPAPAGPLAPPPLPLPRPDPEPEPDPRSSRRGRFSFSSSRSLTMSPWNVSVVPSIADASSDERNGRAPSAHRPMGLLWCCPASLTGRRQPPRGTGGGAEDAPHEWLPPRQVKER